VKLKFAVRRKTNKEKQLL